MTTPTNTYPSCVDASNVTAVNHTVGARFLGPVEPVTLEDAMNLFAALQQGDHPVFNYQPEHGEIDFSLNGDNDLRIDIGQIAFRVSANTIIPLDAVREIAQLLLTYYLENLGLRYEVIKLIGQTSLYIVTSEDRRDWFEEFAKVSPFADAGVNLYRTNLIYSYYANNYNHICTIASTRGPEGYSKTSGVAFSLDINQEDQEAPKSMETFTETMRYVDTLDEAFIAATVNKVFGYDVA